MLTKAEYDADLGPLWRFYFVGEGLDRLAGNSQPSELLLRAADSGYNTITLANGFALQNPQTRPGGRTGDRRALAYYGFRSRRTLATRWSLTSHPPLPETDTPETMTP